MEASLVSLYTSHGHGHGGCHEGLMLSLNILQHLFLTISTCITSLKCC